MNYCTTERNEHDEEEEEALREVHVYPGYGPEHSLDRKCWCHPGHSVHCHGVIFVHNVMH
jgi:hypothetical protein